MTSRRVGVEEEMLLLDAQSLRLRPVAAEVVNHEDVIEHELFLEQVEIQSQPHVDVAAVRSDLQDARQVAARAAREAGARLAAVPTPLLPDQSGVITPKPRYHHMAQEFTGLIHDALVCGMHVHVEIDSDDEGVGVIDRLRPWLPLILAMSANSPFHSGTDTGFASWRAQLWDALPSAGATERFENARAYHGAVADLVTSGAAIDTGMIYFDARLSRSFPTVEVRVADVCTELDDAMAIAAVVRALVDTLASSWRNCEPFPLWRVDLLRAARWRARRDGLSGSLIDPVSGRLVPAASALSTMIATLGPALRASQDFDLVAETVTHLLRTGTGAQRQRRVAGRDRDLSAVAADVIARTSPRV